MVQRLTIDTFWLIDCRVSPRRLAPRLYMLPRLRLSLMVSAAVYSPDCGLCLCTPRTAANCVSLSPGLPSSRSSGTSIVCLLNSNFSLHHFKERFLALHCAYSIGFIIDSIKLISSSDKPYFSYNISSVHGCEKSWRGTKRNTS